MHIQFNFQLIIKSPKLLPLQSMPTNQPKHILLKHHTSSHSHHLLTQLLHHHNSHTTNTIFSSRPPQHISPSLCLKYFWTLFFPIHLRQTTLINHHPSPFFTTSPPFALRLRTFHIPFHTPKHQSYCTLCLHILRWKVALSFLCRQVSPIIIANPHNSWPPTGFHKQDVIQGAYLCLPQDHNHTLHSMAILRPSKPLLQLHIRKTFFYYPYTHQTQTYMHKHHTESTCSFCNI